MAQTDPYELLKLEAGWDGYRAGPISLSVVEKAKEVGDALAVVLTGSPLQYFPGSDGHIQIEYNANGIEIECDVWVETGNEG